MGTNGKRIIVAGATGQLGKLIVKNLLERGAFVIALSRESSEQSLESHPNLQSIRVDYSDSSSLEKACSGGDCVVSALSGLRDVIVERRCNYSLRQFGPASNGSFHRTIALITDH